MPKVLLPQIPPGLEAQFAKVLQFDWTGHQQRIRLKSGATSIAGKKSFAARCPFSYWATFWKSLIYELKHDWQLFHTKTGARGWGVYVQDNNNRRKWQILQTDLHDIIVKPTGCYNIPAPNPGGPYLYIYIYNGDYVLSNPERPSRPQKLLQLDISNCRRLKVDVKIRTIGFTGSHLTTWQINPIRYYKIGNNGYAEGNINLVHPDDQGNLDFSVTAFNADLPAGQTTTRYLIPLYNFGPKGRFFFLNFTLKAVTNAGTEINLLSTTDLSDVGKIYTGHLEGAVLKYHLYVGWGGPTFTVDFYPKYL